jgi:transposase
LDQNFDAERSRVSALLKDGVSIRDAAEELGLPKGKVERIRKKLKEEGEL